MGLLVAVVSQRGTQPRLWAVGDSGESKRNSASAMGLLVTVAIQIGTQPRLWAVGDSGESKRNSAPAMGCW